MLLESLFSSVETTYEEDANRDAEVPVGVGGAVNMTLAVAPAEGRNAVNKEELPLIWSVAPESMIQGLGDEEGTVLVSRAV